MNSIKRYRKLAKMTQQKLADEIGVSRQSIVRYEAGVTPRWNDVVAISARLSCTPEELMSNPCQPPLGRVAGENRKAS